MKATLCVQCTDVADVACVSQCLCYCTRITRITVAFAFSQSFLPVRLHGSCHRHSCHRRLHAYLLGYRILLRSTKQSKCTRSHHMCACVIKLKRRKLACPVDGRTVPPHACSYTDCGAMCAHQFRDARQSTNKGPKMCSDPWKIQVRKSRNLGDHQ